MACPTKAGHAKVTLSKTAWTLALVVVFFPIAIPPLHRSKGRYFPETALFSARVDNIRLTTHIGRVLDAMGELPLRALTPSKQTVDIYRYLEVSNQQHPFCVRVEKKGDMVTLRLAILEGLWPRTLGIVAVERERKLDLGDWRELTRRVEEAAFWSLDEDRDRSDVRSDNWYVFEGLKDHQHHVIALQDSQASVGTPLYDLSTFMIELTRFRFE